MSERLPDQGARERIDRELDRDLLVAAGAGSGKTSKLVDRYLALLEQGRHPHEIAVVTFTRKAAGEMKQRVRDKLRERAASDERWRRIVQSLEEAPIETIDAFCLRLLRAEALTAGIDPGFEILDPATQESLPRQVAETLLRRRLAAHDPAAQQLLAGLDSFPDAVTAIVAALARRRDWRNPFLTAPEHPLAARIWGWLRGDETVSLPTAEELRATLAAEQEEWLTCCLRDQCDSLACRELRALWATLRERRDGVPAADGFVPIYDCIEAWLAAVDAEEWDAAWDCLADLVACNFSKGSAKPWGVAKITEIRDPAKVLRDWAKKLLAEDDEERLTAATEASVALWPLVKAAEEALWRRKLQLGMLAFDDLVLKAAELLAPAENRPILERLQARYRVVLVDEYQDTDRLQDRLFRHLAGDRPGSFFAVGDDKQSIYGWRNAEIEVFNQARETAGDGLVPLTTTFRLAPALAETLNRLFAAPELMGPEEHDEPQAARFAPLEARHDPRRVVLPGAPVRLLVSECATKDELRAREAAAIADEIVAMVEDEQPEFTDPAHDRDTEPTRRLGYGDIGVLARSGRCLDDIRAALLARDVPVRTERGALCRRPEVADLLAAARWLLTPLDGVALLGLLRGPLLALGDDTIYWIARERPLPAAVAALLDSPQPEVPGLAADDLALLTAALERLRRWREAAALRPLSAWLREIVDEVDYRALLALLPDPGRRLANLEKLFDELAALERTGLNADEVLRQLETRRESGPNDDREGAAYDADAAAVTLSTVHGAKGLEWPVVIVADLCRPRKAGADRRPVGTWHGVPVAAGRVAEKLALPRMLQAAAEPAGPCLPFEGERLLYVAMTRARDRLILSGAIEPGRPTPYSSTSWFSALAAAIGYEPDAPPTVPGIELKRLTEPGAPLPDPIPARREVVARLAAATPTGPELPSPPPPPPRVASPSALAQERARQTAAVGRVEPVQLPAPVREKMTGFQRGSIVHELLRLAAATRREPRLGEVGPAAVGQGVLLDPEADRPVAEHLLETAVKAFALPIVQEALTAPRVFGEVPFLLADGERILEGRMDLIAVWDGRVLLIDYKTGGLSDQLLAQYAEETRLYARALAARFPGRPVEIRLPLLDLGRVEAIDPAVGE